MNHALELFICYLGMTGVTQVLDFFLQQAAELGYMRIVAGEAITFSCRFMIHPFLKIIAVMTGETVNCRGSYSVANQKKEQHHGQKKYWS